MKTIKFLGACDGVTGSCYLLKGNSGGTILIDLGLYQGGRETENLNFSPLQFDAKNLQAVLLTHAHLDHCGRLPLLVQAGYHGKIYATLATGMITNVALLDAAKVGQEENKGQVLYTKEQAEQLCGMITGVNYDLPIALGEFIVTFRNAGHILGSSSIEISSKQSSGHTIVFSGDLGNTPQNIIRPTEYISRAQTVVMESTYGDSTHPVEDVPAIIRKEINTVENSGATLIIPVFSIERTQDVLHIIGHLVRNGVVRKTTPVFLDSPMAIEVTDIFKQFPKLYNSELSRDTEPFDFPSLTCTKIVEQSKAIFNVRGPKVIIAGSGMMSGGRVLHHLLRYIPLSSTRLLIVGYQAAGTLGREIQDGVKQITINGQTISVKATVNKIEALSCHADQPKLINWLKHIHGVERIYLVHGEDRQKAVLSEKIKTVLGINNVFIPISGREAAVTV